MQLVIGLLAIVAVLYWLIGSQYILIAIALAMIVGILKKMRG